MKRMLWTLLVSLFLLAVPSYPQGARPFKDLIFPQVAVGGGYETSITVTNRGAATYTGTLFFLTGKGKEWNPTVNGTAVTKGSLDVSISAGGTTIFAITGGGTTESGFAGFLAKDAIQTNFLEGNLTYFVKTGDKISDCVGITPATELFLSTIPFDDFQNLALAFANRDPQGTTANIALTVYSDNNVQLQSKTITLQKNEHLPTFAYQLFPGLSLKRGRIDIQSDVAIVGTALSFVQSQFSSVPLLPTMRVYDVTASLGTGSSKSQMSLWSEGLYLRGYILVYELLGSPITPEAYLVSGQIVGGKLRLLFYGKGNAFGGREVTGLTSSDSYFTFDSTSATGGYYLTFVAEKTVQTGTFTMTRSH
jgi:hypothetical protein